MVHMLASHLRSEFLAVPELVRFDMPLGANGLEPTLLIKSNSLSLKYVIRQRSLRVLIARVGKKLAYAVEIPDDPTSPALAWSLMQLPNEASALTALMGSPRCVVFLFNELAVSIAWTEIQMQVDISLKNAIDQVEFYDVANQADDEAACVRLEQIRVASSHDEAQIFSFEDIEWHELHATYIKNSAGSSSLSLFHTDEGGQQEELAVWLTDVLHPRGCVKSPQVQEKIPRELCDVLLSHEFGAFLIESKSLNVLGRDNLPDRKKLAKDISKHVEKAAKQLIGGVRNLKNGLIVKDADGTALDIEREKPSHAIILVPDLTLLQDSTEFGALFISKFMEATGGFLHILDPANLLRAVQAAEMIAKNSQVLTKIAAFDWYLMQRAEIAFRSPTPYVNVLFRAAPNCDHEEG